MEPKTEADSSQLSVEDLLRRKAALEVASLERSEKFDIEIEPEKRRKLFLESESLRWQTTLIYRASQFATIFTIFATLFGVYEAYDKLVTDKRTEVEQRSKESTERTTALFRANLQSLLQYPIDKNQTISQAVFELRDLTNVVENGFKGDEAAQKRKREEVGSLLAQLIRSPEFDLKQTRNTDFDRKAMDKENSEFYANYLISNPIENRDILSKYKAVLADVHDRDFDYCEKFLVDPEDPAAFIESKVSKDQAKFFQYAYLFHAYKKHVDLLAQSSDPHIRENLNLAYCWFWGATRNPSLTKAIFGGTDQQVTQKSASCEPLDPKPQRSTVMRMASFRNSARPRVSIASTGGSFGLGPMRRSTSSVHYKPMYKSTSKRRRSAHAF